MTVFDFKDEGVWFDMEDGGRVKLRTLTPSDWVVIRKATVKKEPVVQKVEGGKHQLFEREITDEYLQVEMINDASIMSWENLFDGNDNPIPCTRENKVKLMMMKDARFRNFVNEKLGILNKADEEHKEASEKNS